jgi:hypothetical protein
MSRNEPEFASVAMDAEVRVTFTGLGVLRRVRPQMASICGSENFFKALSTNIQRSFPGDSTQEGGNLFEGLSGFGHTDGARSPKTAGASTLDG